MTTNQCIEEMDKWIVEFLYKYGEMRVAMRREIRKEAIQEFWNIINHAKQEAYDAVEKEVIKENETPEEYQAKMLTLKELDMSLQAVKFYDRNELRIEQRTALAALREKGI